MHLHEETERINQLIDAGSEKIDVEICQARTAL
jgi:hypothetical protein